MIESIDMRLSLMLEFSFPFRNFTFYSYEYSSPSAQGIFENQLLFMYIFCRHAILIP